MSKQYKGKTCTYCAETGASSTGDHVVARSFFAVDERDNLPQVPTCTLCNSTKSALETYLTALLPQGAKHQDDVSNYWSESRRRIDRNKKLYRELQTGATITNRLNETGKLANATLLPIDSSKLLDLSRYIAKGLLFHHWKVIVPKDQIVCSQFMSEAGESIFPDTISKLKKAVADAGSPNAVQTTGLVQLGKQAVTYEGFFSALDSPLSMWRLNFYRARLGVPGENETTSSLMMLIPNNIVV